ncbi:MAG: hypothetical protein CMJ12_04950 [Pelagibacterales bacterium]|nr:hypothetical protein [Pelagibacterales bacterium]PPR16553.1 MAG: hypothetical protein CFH33_00583 [Alphaproteobacteria bacterium MarineAlpha9_Bin3]|tara:strand:+ start:3206 stop:3469 length:264 start_codon:yes stop_codon:yes gene_type:complete
MKKIFVIEINEKDKNISNEEAISELDQQFKEFYNIINNNKNLYVRFKRVGNTWQNILNNFKKMKINTYKNKKKEKKVVKPNHLKVVK